MPGELTIGRLAAVAGVNVETIRFYERRGLLDQPAKPLGGHRRYAVAAAKRVRFVRRAQALGFTLDDIAALLRLDGALACAETRDLAQRKLASVDQKLGDLAAIRVELAKLIRQCNARRARAECPIIQALVSD